MSGEKRWEVTTFPEELQGRRALILPGAFLGDVETLFEEAGFWTVQDYEEADDIVFIGGTDISPFLYGEAPLPFTQRANQARDDKEVTLYHRAVRDGKPVIGICRGAQLLHALNGGKLWQHVNNHAGMDHDIFDYLGYVVKSSSIHHQMLRVNKDIHVIAQTLHQLSDVYHSEELVVQDDATLPVLEIEAGAYYETKSFFVQGHPEVGTDEYRSWFFTHYQRFLARVGALTTVEEIV